MLTWDEYKEKVKTALDSFESDEKILSVLQNAREERRKVFVAGNGGSAALADHYVCDLSKGANKDWLTNNKRFSAICLSTNLGYLTAAANDSAYDEVFKQQLINLARPGDVVILISSSGNSPNIVKAAEYAREHGLVVIGIVGFSGGKLKQLAHHTAYMPSNEYEVCEDVHGIFGHYLTAHFKEQ
jgi:D-sedoheptulose 7-phosphate isomerase